MTYIPSSPTCEKHPDRREVHMLAPHNVTNVPKDPLVEVVRSPGAEEAGVNPRTSAEQGTPPLGWMHRPPGLATSKVSVEHLD